MPRRNLASSSCPALCRAFTCCFDDIVEIVGWAKARLPAPCPRETTSNENDDVGSLFRTRGHGAARRCPPYARGCSSRARRQRSLRPIARRFLPGQDRLAARRLWSRSEEHTSELQSRFGISYAVFCLK